MAILECLESRVLFSASAAQISAMVHTVHVDEAKLRSSIHVVAVVLAKGQKTIGSDLAKLGVSSAQASLVQSVGDAASTLVSAWSNSINTLAPEFNTDMTTLIAQEKQYKKTPGDTNLKDEIRAALGGFTGIFLSGNQTFTLDTIAPTIYTTLDAIPAANPTSSKVAADVNKIETGLKAAVAKSQKAAGKLFATDDGNFQALWPYV